MSRTKITTEASNESVRTVKIQSPYAYYHSN